MSKIKDTFFGGAEKRAGRKQAEAFGQAGELVSEQFGVTEEQISPFLERQVTPEAGLSLQKQQAISGALGPEAQAEAFAAFEESPGVAFAREQGVRGIESETAVTGGAGGGDRLRELTRFSQGLALQDLQNQFGRLSVTGAGERDVVAQEAQEIERQQRAAFGLGGIRGSTAVQEANLLTGGAAKVAEGITGSAAGLRAGVQQVASAVVGGVAGGPIGAVQGGFGV